MRKIKHHIVNLGQNLMTASGTAMVTTSSGQLKEKTVWENHGLFASRQLALKFAQKRRPGQKLHIEGRRFDASPVSRPSKSE